MYPKLVLKAQSEHSADWGASTVAFMPDGQESTGDTEGSDAALAEQFGADGLLAVGENAGDDGVGFGAGQRGIGLLQLDGQ